jgi:endo-1,4-beta-D-glucanase Y
MKVISCAFVALYAATSGCAKAPVTDETGSGGSTGEGGSTTGAGGSTTGAGGTAPAGACMPQDPAPAAGGAAFPFPQHRLSANCSYPVNCNDADITATWTRWKQTFVVSGGGTTLRVQRPENANDTVSEGMAYGMLLAVYMNDKPTFDGLWGYAQTRLNGNGVMNWHYTSSGGVQEQGGATDADEDMAFALVMADKQWGGYQTPATTLVKNILAHEVESGSNVLKPGDAFGGSSETNPSYFAPAYYRVFASYTGNAQWMQVVTASYTVLNKCANPTTGLVPDWCNAQGGATRSSRYYYDATRTPWRIATDACWNGDASAKAWLTKVGAFFAKTGVVNIKDGYNLDGTPTGQSNALAFVGPAGTSGMASSQAQLMKDAYSRTAAGARNGTGPAYSYFNASWGVLSLLLMSGNFVNLAGP